MATSTRTGLRAAAARTAEALRLEEIHHGVHWRRWGPYLSERQWGTVREDYSEYGNAWDYFPHDHARSRAYRWGEDGIGGFGDDRLRLCLGLALWNGRDPILKERLFGLTNAEGNHGEDVKELYYYLDGTPTHSYMRMLYKYPQAAFPYSWLVEENRRRGMAEPEFELIDTGVFDENRYFDVEIEYAKADVDDILMLVTIHNRGHEPASLHVLPQLWARNIWSWKPDSKKPRLLAREDASISIDHPELPPLRLFCDDRPEFLFCENDTNFQRLFGMKMPGRYFKDGINDYIVNGDLAAVNPVPLGTKVAAHYRLTLRAEETARLALAARAHQCRWRTRRASTPPFANAAPRPTNSTRLCSRTWSIRTSGSCNAKRSPACCGQSSSTTSTYPSGWAATRSNPRRQHRGAMDATPTGSI